jgi:hypothetical protein
MAGKSSEYFRQVVDQSRERRHGTLTVGEAGMERHP